MFLISRIKDAFFSTESLRKQAYIQFTIAVCLFPLIFLPTRLLIQITYLLSIWAIIISAQTFISAAEARKDLENGNANRSSNT